MKCCVYTRAFFEDEYLDYFIKHYLNLGFDKIIILKTDKEIFYLNDEYTNFVDIFYVDNHADQTLQLNQDLLKQSEYDWVLSVDLDEYLLLTSKYKTIKDYLQEKLNNNNLINCFYFRWAMIEKYDNCENNVFTDILKTYKIFQNNHIKSMFKISDLINISTSHYSIMNNSIIHFENFIYKNPYSTHKIYDDSYEETIIIHIHTRSINDLIYKSFSTLFDEKKIISKEAFVQFINNYDGSIITNQLLNEFNNYIGEKAKLPFTHISNVINNKLAINNFNFDKYIFSIKTNNSNKMITTFLEKNNINKDNYFFFINNLHEYMISNKTFIL